jgi:predicted acetyltransferase
MEDPEIRELAAEQLEPWLRALAVPFGDEMNEKDMEAFKDVLELDRTLAAYDGDAIVGTASAFKFDMTIPGGEIPTAGVTMVAVLPTHRRRGLLSKMMRKQLADVHSWGEPIAALWASEGSIYGRYGYGIATKQAGIDLERDRARFSQGIETTGRVRMLTIDEALKAFPPIYDRIRKQTPGMMSRSDSFWRFEHLRDAEHLRGGAGPLFCCLLEIEGKAEGFCMYRVEQKWDHFPKSVLRVNQALATSDKATRELWNYLFGIDLIERIRTPFTALPLDHPLFLALGESRRLLMRIGDGLWLRIVDLKTTLERRSYAQPGTIVFEVTDDICPWNAGRWKLEASPDGGRVTETGDAPDLTVDIRELGSAYLGGISWGEMLRAGLISESRPGAAFEADGIFRTERAPCCPEIF